MLNTMALAFLIEKLMPTDLTLTTHGEAIVKSLQMPVRTGRIVEEPPLPHAS